MPFYVDHNYDEPFKVDARFVDLEDRVPELSDRAAVNDLLRDARSAGREGEGARLGEDEVPRHLVLSKPLSANTTLPDVFSTDLGELVVSRRVRDVIEAYDPDEHQFFAITVSRRLWPCEGTEPMDGEWFILHVYRRSDTIDPERSPSSQPRPVLPSANPRTKKTSLGRYIPSHRPDLTLRRSALPADLNIRRETAHIGGFWIMSDRLAERFDWEGIVFLRRTRLKFA